MNRRVTRFLAVIGVGLLGLALLGPGTNMLAQARPGTAAQQESPCLVTGRWGMMADWGSGSGMMGGEGKMGGMWGAVGSMGMMGYAAGTATPITIADAQQRLATFAAGCGPDVTVGDIEEFASNYDAQLVDGTGNGLGEVLVDRYTGAVYPEPGPNMMWNTAWGLGTTGETRYDRAAAEQIAATFLAGYLPGTSVVEGQAFPGYYTFDFGHDDEVEGMLSVNAATDDVWVHTWHGPALADVHDDADDDDHDATDDDQGEDHDADATEVHDQDDQNADHGDDVSDDQDHDSAGNDDTAGADDQGEDHDTTSGGDQGDDHDADATVVHDQEGQSTDHNDAETDDQSDDHGEDE